MAGFRRHTMRVRLWEVAVVPDDFRSTDTVRFPTCLDGLRKHFLDITRVLDTTDIDFRRHGIRTGGLSAGVPVSTLLAGGRRQVVPVLCGPCGPCGNSGKKKTRTAPVAESSQKIILFDYIVSIPRAARMCKRSFAILYGGFLAS